MNILLLTYIPSYVFIRTLSSRYLVHGKHDDGWNVNQSKYILQYYILENG